MYPFLCDGHRLLPCLVCRKQRCDEHQGACILPDHVLLQIYAQEWNCRVIYGSSVFFVFFFLGKLLFKRTGQINSKNHNVKVPSMSKIVLKNYKEKQNCREALCAISIKT